jgi:hypothetical protein
MTNRREFLQIGVSATAWPLVARAAQAAGIEPAQERLPVTAVVYDARFPESVAFARRSEALGLKALPIDNGDMTRIWFNEIHYRWRDRPIGLAGFTAHGPMFCFAELARDVGMRVVFRGEHTASRAGVAHAFLGPIPMLADATSACRRSHSLGATMADIVAACPSGRLEIASAALTAPGAPPDAEEPLYTWVIARAVRA